MQKMFLIIAAFTFALLAFKNPNSFVVTGKVTDIDGNPVSFASVRIKGTNSGVSADVNGNYSIKVIDENAVLVITGASFKTAEVKVGARRVINTVLEKRGGTDLKEVVVTSAFGIKRTARSTASNVQNLTGDQLNAITQTNVNKLILLQALPT